ncbi:MAG TPA: hypothetical protein V6C95_00685 [Coleofasciculaceae cyanobacterium]
MRRSHLTPQQIRNRQALLNKVWKLWIEGVLKTSLHDQVLIEVGLEERTDAVVFFWNREVEASNQVQEKLLLYWN